MEITDFVNTINKLRLANKKEYYSWDGTVCNQSVIVRGYGGWLQVLRVNGARFDSRSDISVKEFKSILRRSVGSIN